MRPVYPTPLLGYRSWYLYWDSLELRPIALKNAQAWKPGVNKAICEWNDVGLDHSVPNTHCDCGLYAWHDPEQLTGEAAMRLAIGTSKELDLISGSIIARGDVQVHADGFRCQEAQIIGLCYQPAKKDTHRLKALQRLSERYRVPVFDNTEQLQAHAERLGCSYPITERPLSDTAYTPAEASFELQFGAGAAARAARDLLRSKQVSRKAVEHFQIGVLPSQRRIRAPLVLPGEPGYEAYNYGDTINWKIFDSVDCRSCGKNVTFEALNHAAYKAHKEGKQKQRTGLFNSRQPDFRGCPYCSADSETAGVGWLNRDGRMLRKSIIWASHASYIANRNGVDGYNLESAKQHLEQSEYLYLTDTISSCWMMWSQGLKAVIGREELTIRPFSDSANARSWAELLHKAHSLAEAAGKELVFVHSKPMNKHAREALVDLSPEARVIPVTDVSDGWSTSAAPLNASDYYPE